MFGKLNQSQRITLVTNNPSLPTGILTSQLAQDQLGIFVKSKGSAEPFIAVAQPGYRRDSVFKIALGKSTQYQEALSRAQIPSWPHETVEFSGKQILDWKGIKAQHRTKEDMVAIGYDGVDVTKSLRAKKNEKIKFYVYLTGQPISRLYNSVRPLVREYFVDPACIEDCSDPCGEQACQRIQQSLIDQIKRDKFNQIPISRFLKATPITKCVTPPPAPGTLENFSTYSVNVPDDGTDGALGSLQSQYPGKAITRTGRTGITSTYSLDQLTSATAPAAASNAGIVLIPDCSVCPTGYTKVAAQKVFEARVAYGATLAPLPGETSRTKISAGLDGDVYTIYVDPAQSTDAVLEAGDPDRFTVYSGSQTQVGNEAYTEEEEEVTTEYSEQEADATGASIDLYYVGITRDVCKLAVAGTYAWAVTSCTTRAPKNYFITLRDQECKLPGCNANTFTDRLAELQAAYPDLVISIKAAGTCVHQYQAVVYSQEVLPGCTQDQYQWHAPQPYELNPWQAEVVANADGTDCACGVVLEAARFIQHTTDCTFPMFGYDMRDDDTVHIQISNHSHDYTGAYCDPNDFPVTKLQVSDYAIGWGRSVIDHEMESMSYFMKEYSTNPLIREIYGYSFVAKPDLYYDQYQLTIEQSFLKSGWFDKNFSRMTLQFYFPEGQGKQFEAAINGLVASSDLDIATVSL